MNIFASGSLPQGLRADTLSRLVRTLLLRLVDERLGRQAEGEALLKVRAALRVWCGVVRWRAPAQHCSGLPAPLAQALQQLASHASATLPEALHPGATRTRGHTPCHRDRDRTHTRRARRLSTC
jgi:hypothetical protein